MEINKYFRNHHFPGALLDEISGSVKPQLLAETRWNSQLKCIDTFIRNEDIIDTRIRNLTHKVGLFHEVKNLLQQLSPISKALDTLHSDTSTIAHACEQWLAILQCPDLKPHEKKIKHRFKQAMTPHHFLANLLHPVYRGSKLLPDHVNTTHELLLEISPDLLPELLSFMSDSLSLLRALFYESTTNYNQDKAYTCS